MIPRDLLGRTWTYLHRDAGSATTGVRDPGGHGISTAGLGELHRWLRRLTAANEGASELRSRATQ